MPLGAKLWFQKPLLSDYLFRWRGASVFSCLEVLIPGCSSASTGEWLIHVRVSQLYPWRSNPAGPEFVTWKSFAHWCGCTARLKTPECGIWSKENRVCQSDVLFRMTIRWPFSPTCRGCTEWFEQWWGPGPVVSSCTLTCVRPLYPLHYLLT